MEKKRKYYGKKTKGKLKKEGKKEAITRDEKKKTRKMRIGGRKTDREI